MLIQFSFENYRSFRTPAMLSLLAGAGKENEDSTFLTESGRLLRSVAVFGANAAGKSNLIKAFSAAVMIVRSSQTRQLDEPILYADAFLFDSNGEEDTSFEFDIIAGGTRYIYGFSCNRERISEEHLSVYKSRKPSLVFSREGENYHFTDSRYRQALSPLTVKNTPNKLFLSTATAWNAEATKDVYLWFSNSIDVCEPSIPYPVLRAYDSDSDGSLRAFTKRLLKESDINITDYSIESERFQMGAVGPTPQKMYSVTAYHEIGKGDVKTVYTLPIREESRGTQNLFFLSPQIKKALDIGSVFCIDELDSSLHPSLVLYLAGLFNSSETNPKNAQLIFTSHTMELLSTHYMRRDQIYFVDKDNSSGISELYSLDDYSVRTREDVRKAYLCGRFGAVPNIG